MSFSVSFEKMLEFLHQNYYREVQTEYDYVDMELNLDDYFESSTYESEYFSVEEYFAINAGIQLNSRINLTDYFSDKEEQEKILFIESLVNLLSHTDLTNELNQKFLNKIKSMLERYNYTYSYDNGDYIIKSKTLIKEGYFCTVEVLNDFLVRKKLKKNLTTEENIRRFKYEFDMMNKLSKSDMFLNVYEDKENQNSYIMDKCDCNLFEYLSENKLHEKDKVNLILDILTRLEYASLNGITHRDLHLGNILIKDGLVKICDFGLAKDSSVIRSLMTSYGVKNNHLFVSPEGLHNFQDVDVFSDIFSVGKIMDYIINDGNMGKANLLSSVIFKCTQYEKKDRYPSFKELKEAVVKLSTLNKTSNDSEYITTNIINLNFKDNEVQYIYELSKSDELSNFIVLNKFSKLSEVFKISPVEVQREIIDSLDRTFVNATGYRNFKNYDIFADIAYDIITNKSIPVDVKMKAAEILNVCASYRYYADDLKKKVANNSNIDNKVKIVLSNSEKV